MMTIGRDIRADKVLRSKGLSGLSELRTFPASIDDTLDELAELLNNGKLAFLFGAGLSKEYPLRLPTADTLQDTLRGVITE